MRVVGSTSSRRTRVKTRLAVTGVDSLWVNDLLGSAGEGAAEAGAMSGRRQVSILDWVPGRPGTAPPPPAPRRTAVQHRRDLKPTNRRVGQNRRQFDCVGRGRPQPPPLEVLIGGGCNYQRRQYQPCGRPQQRRLNTSRTTRTGSPRTTTSQPRNAGWFCVRLRVDVPAYGVIRPPGGNRSPMSTAILRSPPGSHTSKAWPTGRWSPRRPSSVPSGDGAAQDVRRDGRCADRHCRRRNSVG